METSQEEEAPLAVPEESAQMEQETIEAPEIVSEEPVVQEFIDVSTSPLKIETEESTVPQSHPSPVTGGDRLPGVATTQWLIDRLEDTLSLYMKNQSRTLDSSSESAPTEVRLSRKCKCLCANGPSSSLKESKSKFPSLASGAKWPRVRVKLVCGSDLLLSFGTPGLWEAADLDVLLREFGIICITRPEFDAVRFIKENDILHKYEVRTMSVCFN
ncbi:Nicotinamide/nicotinic acid mononucleotide adenylyltransferase 1 [Cichlidogyrus casuarinus]|uniref:Nicotinamide/nicotinic acid mononucleotide adenylyltransferase 1 n=1 Tax=Cichlidogyrus casuarinus TaxID=1844966 RepID=A0ABD2Q557_9PLAT